MKRLGQFTTEELFDFSYTCGCGRVHAFKAPRIVTDEPVGAIAELLGSGRVMIVSADDVDQTTPDGLERALLKRGYKVDRLNALPFSPIFDVQEIEDDVRLLIAYGGSALIEFCKLVAFRLDIKLVAFPVGFEYGCVLSDDAVLVSEGRAVKVEAKRPDLVVIDYDGLMRAGEDVIASGYGRVLACMVGIYDYYFAGKVYGTPFCTEIMNATLIAATRVIKEEGDVRSRYGLRLLSDSALRLAIFAEIAGNISGGEHQLAVTLERYLAVRTRDKRLFGENLYISAVLVSGLYKTFLRAKPFRLTVPPARCRSVVMMRRLLMIPDTYSLGFLRGYTPAKTVDEFKLNLFREELLDVAEKIHLLVLEGQNVMRRVYSDAGFFMKYYVGTEEMLALLTLAPDYAEGQTLLTYVKDCGLMEHFERRTLA